MAAYSKKSATTESLDKFYGDLPTKPNLVLAAAIGMYTIQQNRAISQFYVDTNNETSRHNHFIFFRS